MTVSPIHLSPSPSEQVRVRSSLFSAEQLQSSSSSLFISLSSSMDDLMLLEDELLQLRLQPHPHSYERNNDDSVSSSCSSMILSESDADFILSTLDVSNSDFSESCASTSDFSATTNATTNSTVVVSSFTATSPTATTTTVMLNTTNPPPDLDSMSTSSSACSSSSDNDDDDDDDDELYSSYKNVRFSLAPTKVIPHLHYRDMTEDEREATWLSMEDRYRMAQENKEARYQYATFYGQDAESQALQPQSSLSSFDTSWLMPIMTGTTTTSNTTKSAQATKPTMYNNSMNTTRGLEPRRKRLVRQSRLVVIQEQERQYRAKNNTKNYKTTKSTITFCSPRPSNNHEYNEYLIASKYALITQEAVQIAYARGNDDAMCIMMMEE